MDFTKLSLLLHVLPNQEPRKYLTFNEVKSTKILIYIHTFAVKPTSAPQTMVSLLLEGLLC